ncbi:MAG: FMN-binding negative transcriptional regulator [Caulobacteraceae bacterium]|nr:FMN-binding negative transcriptional regulator [Caulobacteraceae bacterium]
MHPAPAFLETDLDRLTALVAETGLALIIGAGPDGPLCAHAPVLFGDGRLRFHLSAANPLARVLTDSARALAVVTGPQAYVSPDWYGLEDQVPTWNYLSAEIEGPVRRLDRAQAADLLDALSAVFEARLAPKPPWTRDKMTPGRFEAMLGGITAFEVVPDRMRGVRKLSQNKPAAAQTALAEALEAQGGPSARLAALIRDDLT